MMSRGILYSAVIVGLNFWLSAVIAGAVIVGWNDLKSEVRMKTMAIDFVGVGLLIVATLWIVTND